MGVESAAAREGRRQELDMEEKKRLFTIDGVTLAGTILLINECAKLGDINWMLDKTSYFWAVVCVVVPIGLDLMYREKDEEKLFRNCGFENKDKQIPLIIKKNPKDMEEIKERIRKEFGG